MPPDVDLLRALEHLNALARDVQDANLESFTSVRKTESKTGSPNATSPGGGSSRPYDDPSTARQLYDAGYEVIPILDIPGFTPLYPVRSYFFSL